MSSKEDLERLLVAARAHARTDGGAAQEALDRLEATLAHLERGAEYAAQELSGKRLTVEQREWLEADEARKATG